MERFCCGPLRLTWLCVSVLAGSHTDPSITAGPPLMLSPHSRRSLSPEEVQALEHCTSQLSWGWEALGSALVCPWCPSARVRPEPALCALSHHMDFHICASVLPSF